MIKHNTSTTALLAAVPYLLLLASQSVTFTTVVARDGSGLRQLTASCPDGRVGDVTPRLQAASPDYAAAGRETSLGEVILIRNWRWPHAVSDRSREDFSLYIADVAQRPLSMFTYYDWSEPVFIEVQDATPAETEGQSKAILRYVLQMPGRILSVNGTGGRIENGLAVWELAGDQQETILQATSRQVRWGYLLIVIYILAFLAFQAAGFVQRLIKYRPRRI